jgi:sugar lactone lactonase YvrE
MLYAADTGHQRIIRFDPRSATRGDALPRQNEPLKDNALMNGGTLKEIVGAGTLEKPSGLEVHDGLLYVTDAATSRFVVFDKEGHELRHLDTGLPPGSLSGFTFHADGTIYFTDKVAGRILRIDPK